MGAIWQSLKTLNSDHQLIFMTSVDCFPEPNPDPYLPYTNIRRTRWNDFETKTEEKFSNKPPLSSCSADEFRYKHILFISAKQHIPQVSFATVSPTSRMKPEISFGREMSCRRIIIPTSPQAQNSRTSKHLSLLMVTTVGEG